MPIEGTFVDAAAERVPQGSPEVLLKITGVGHGAAHVKAHLLDITRNGKVELENDRDERISGRDEVKALLKDWEGGFSNGRRHKNQRDTMHMVLSMPEGTDPDALKAAVREFAQTTFGENHEYVFALRTDSAHPHCHLTVKCMGFDQRKLQVSKSDLQTWRETFADKLRDQGVAAQATTRRSRRVVRKSELLPLARS